MSFLEHPSIQQEDWRLNVVTTLTAPFQSPATGHTFPVGTPIKATTDVQYDQTTVIRFDVPNVTAMMLDFAKRLWLESSDLIGQFDQTAQNTRQTSSIDAVIEIIEKRMGVVIFAYTALETFANGVIATAYEQQHYRYTQTTKKGTKQMTLDEVERYTPLEEKLATILPAIRHCASPKGVVLWQIFQRLKLVRDRIIHCKIKDLIHSSPADDTLWKLLTDERFHDFASDSKRIIDYYLLAASDRPRWHHKWPY